MKNENKTERDLAWAQIGEFVDLLRQIAIDMKAIRKALDEQKQEREHRSWLRGMGV